MKRLQELRVDPETAGTLRQGTESAGFQPRNGTLSLK